LAATIHRSKSKPREISRAHSTGQVSWTHLVGR